MKKLILAVYLIFGIYIDNLAQLDPIRDKLNFVFANIDKSQIPTGFLEEYGINLVPLDVFNGILTDSNKVDINAWRMVYATLYSSRINAANPLPLLSAVNSAIENAEALNAPTIPVPMVYADYNYLRPDALTANLLTTQNDQLYDVPGRTQSPYYSRKLFAASPSIGYTRTGSVSLIFKPELFYKASNKTLNAIYVDFGDGLGYRTVAWNTLVTGTFFSTGTKQIKIKVKFTDNSIVESYSFIEVLEIPVAEARFEPFQDFIHPFSAKNSHSGGDAYVHYSRKGTERKITKPLIVVEGYDISKVAPKLQSDYQFKHFIGDIDKIPYDLSYQLDDVAGYDLIFVNYYYGTDDIRRNAALLQEVITWVNDEKAVAGSTEPNVVLGISMGGLVARYCLANMTKSGLNPQTRLLITHDSPHRGANTPLGIQALTRAMNETTLVQGLNLFDLIPELKQSNKVLDEPATKQLLIVRATNGTGGYSMNTFLDGEYRSMITFPASGPQPTYRIIATSSGSECGVGSLSPSAELVHLNGKFILSPLPWISRTSWNIEAIVNALPYYGQSQRISKLRIWAGFRFLWVITFDVDLTNKSFNSPSNLLFWDGAPGGTANVKEQAGSRFPSVKLEIYPSINLTINPTFGGDFCFVPTVSALDITNLNSQALGSPYVGGISPSNPARVANFIAQERNPATGLRNQKHATLTARNAEWLYREMEGLPPNGLNCSADCSINYGVVISGAPAVCPTTSSFTLSNFPPGSPIIWSSSSNINLVSGQGTNTASFNTTMLASGTGWIKVTSSGLCGNFNVQKNFTRVGLPGTPTITGTDYACPGGGGCFTVLASNEMGYDVQYYGMNYYSGYPYSGNFCLSTPSYGWSGGAVTARSLNECGSSLGMAVHTVGVSQNCPSFMSISPNPASDVITISINNGGDKLSSSETRTASGDSKNSARTVAIKDEPAGIVEIALFNSYQEKVFHSTETSLREIRIPVSTLPEGLYYLDVTTEHGTIKEQVVIKR